MRCMKRSQTPTFYVDTEGIAAAIPASKRTVDYWRKLGIIPFLKIGGMGRYDIDAVKRALDQRFNVTTGGFVRSRRLKKTKLQKLKSRPAPKQSGSPSTFFRMIESARS